MDIATINDAQLEFAVVGEGEPVLLISPVLSDGFVPLLSERSLAEHYQLIWYRKRGWGGSTHTPPPVTIEDHSADADALLRYLGVSRAHVGGHSSGAAVALQLALDHPEMVHSLLLFEPSILSVPSAGAFFDAATPAFEAYADGEHERALALFMGVVTGFDWPACQTIIEQAVPGAVEMAIKDADTFFGIELPALSAWTFGEDQAPAISQPALSVVGTDTQPLWVEVAAMLRASLPRVEERRIEGVGHLLHIQRPEPVARGIAAFLGRHPMT